MNWKAGIASTMGAIAVLGTAGLAQAQPQTDWLGAGEARSFEGYLSAGENVFSICDANCFDIDMFLYDAESGELVGSDTLEDDIPVVTVPYDGYFLIEVLMVDCRASACEIMMGSDADL